MIRTLDHSHHVRSRHRIIKKCLFRFVSQLSRIFFINHWHISLNAVNRQYFIFMCCPYTCIFMINVQSTLPPSSFYEPFKIFIAFVNVCRYWYWAVWVHRSTMRTMLGIVRIYVWKNIESDNLCKNTWTMKFHSRFFYRCMFSAEHITFRMSVAESSGHSSFCVFRSCFHIVRSLQHGTLRNPWNRNRSPSIVTTLISSPFFWNRNLSHTYKVLSKVRLLALINGCCEVGPDTIAIGRKYFSR